MRNHEQRVNRDTSPMDAFVPSSNTGALIFFIIVMLIYSGLGMASYDALAQIEAMHASRPVSLIWDLLIYGFFYAPLWAFLCLCFFGALVTAVRALAAGWQLVVRAFRPPA